MNRIIRLTAVLILIGGSITAWLLRNDRKSEDASVQLQPFRTTASEGFRKVERPVQVSFPDDFGPHPEYQTEWWYYTGNLETENGRHFGYQLTFFRRGLVPPQQAPDRASIWAADQLYMAHFALTNTQGSNFSAFERFSRGSDRLAGAQAQPYKVWLEDWQVEQAADGTYRLDAKADEIALSLVLADRKRPVLQGEAGYSAKGAEAGNASVYISQTRLASTGTIVLGGEEFTVSGLSWMDHEYSTSALGSGLIGWDWYSLQLDDSSELMLFTLRREDGQTDPFSSGTVIAPDGSTTSLAAEDFIIEVDETWRSPHSGAVYPSGWTIQIPSEELVLQVSPRLADQELNLSFTYWEGAVQLTGERAGRAVSGQGYVELTGYAESMQGQF